MIDKSLDTQFVLTSVTQSAVWTCVHETQKRFQTNLSIVVRLSEDQLVDLVGVGGSDRLQGGRGAETLEGQEDKLMTTWTEDQISDLFSH